MTQRFPTRSRLRPAMVAAVAVATIATGSAYLAMVGFGTDVLEQSVAIAYTTAGVFELSLITVALLAREAAKENRPNGTLLMLTWVLSSASGVFAAWHELFLGHAPGAAAFRFLVPLLAALMWHLALIGDRHLASGRTWSSLRENARMHTLFLSIDAERRARQARRQRGGRLADLRVDRAERRRLRARAVALRTVPPAEVRAQVATWSDALAAVDEATAEAVALADEDAARMTIHADLSPRHDRLTVTVPDQDEPAVEQLADTPQQLTVAASASDDAQQEEIPQEETLFDVGVATTANSDSDEYAERAAAAVEAELSTIARVTTSSPAPSQVTDPRQIIQAEVDAVAADAAAAWTATEGLAQQERQRAVRRAQGPQVRAWRNRGVTIAAIAEALEAGERTVFRIINGDYDTDTSGEGIPAVDTTDKAADQHPVGQGDLVTAR